MFAYPSIYLSLRSSLVAKFGGGNYRIGDMELGQCSHNQISRLRGMDGCLRGSSTIIYLGEHEVNLDGMSGGDDIFNRVAFLS